MTDRDETTWAEISLDGRRRAATWPSRREMLVDLVLLAVFAAGATLLVVLSGLGPGFHYLTALVLLLAYAIAARIPVAVGSGFAVPTEVVLVMALFVLPVAAAPLLAFAGLLLGTLYDAAAGHRHPLRLVICAGDAIHALPPAAVLALAATGPVSLHHWPIYIAALASQFLVDASLAAGREWLRVGVPPLGLLGELRVIYVIDLLLAPVGLLAALADRYVAGSFVLVLPVIAFAWLLAGERQQRLEGLVALKETSEVALTDALTGALNRRGWEQHLEQAGELKAHGVTIALLDMDGLKELNDTQGHAAGDEALAGAVAAWRRHLRPTDVLARIGGDEFAIAFAGLGEPEAAPICERLAQAAGDVSFSVGLASGTPGEAIDEVIARADARLYEIKRARGAERQ